MSPTRRRPIPLTRSPDDVDRAFIAAFQQADAGLGGAAAPATGPHYRPSTAGRAPLSEHLARRREPASPAPVGPLEPGVELDRFTWPPAAESLATAARHELLDLLSTATRGSAASTPTVAFAGARPGVGATTALLATARLVASVGGRVAIVDGAAPHGAAAALGVRRVVPRSAPDGAVDDLLVASRECETSVLAIGAAASQGLVAAALGRLVATHDLVLIDAGEAASAPAWLRGCAEGVTVLLVDAVSGGPVERRIAVDALAELDASPAGIVETFAATA